LINSWFWLFLFHIKKLMDKQKIIEAIRSENFIDIEHEKSKGKGVIVRKLCPYDIYSSGEKKKSGKTRSILLGYEIDNAQKGNCVAKIFLDQIRSVDVLSAEFDGQEIKRLVKSSKTPTVKRDW